MTTVDRIPDRVLRKLQEEGIQDASITGLEKADVDQSVIINGPPGTGKSFEALQRSISRADREGFGPGETTVVTYRRLLAEDLIQRVVNWNAFEPPQLPVTESESRYHHWGTVNAVAARSADFFEQIVGVSRGEMMYGLAGMLDEDAARAFCNQVRIQYKAAAPWFETQWTTFKSLYDYAKNNMLDVGEYRYLDSSQLNSLRSDIRADRLLTEFKEQWTEPFSDVVSVYEEWKRQNDVFDFYEQLEAGLVGDLPPMRHLVIDEYHDAYPLMAAVCERWLENADVAVVAGDPDQVVNAFSGADPRFFEQLPDRVSTSLTDIALSRSYRCPDEHFAAAAQVLGKVRSPPRLQTDGPGLLREYRPPSIDRHPNGGWQLPDSQDDGTPALLWADYGPEIMFLARTRMQVDSIGAHLDDQGIVYQSQTDIAGNWTYRLALMRAIRLVEGVRPVDQARLDNTEAHQYEPIGNKKLTANEARLLLRHSDKRYFYDYSGLQSLVQNCYTESEPVPLPLSKWIEHIRTGWFDTYGEGLQSISQLTREDGELSERDKRAMSAAWKRYNDQPIWTLDALAQGTQLRTIHASKGMQSSDVVLYDGVTNRIRNETRTHEDIRANEARCWYVGLTRAAERLHLVRNGHDWTKDWLPEGLVAAAKKEAAKARRQVADD